MDGIFCVQVLVVVEVLTMFACDMTMRDHRADATMDSTVPLLVGMCRAEG